MVTIEIDDDVWAVFKKSWELFDVKGKKHLVKMLEDDILDRSIEVIEDAEKKPERYGMSEIEMEKWRNVKPTISNE
jgi:hypothetical protein